MYTFIQLLIRNTLLGFAIYICSAATIIFSVDTYLQKQQVNHQKNIIEFSNKTLSQNDVKFLAQLLRKQAHYQFLSIGTPTGENLYSFQAEASPLSLPFITPIATTVTLDNDLTITYQLNIQDITQLLISLLVSLFALIVIAVLISAIISKRQYQNLLSNVRGYIKQEFSQFFAFTKQETQKIQPAQTHFNIPELTENITKIKNLFENNAQTSSELKEEAYIDKLTQIGNRNSFIQYFQSTISENKEVKLGVMSITRCSELQTINQIHGYKGGDAYIAQVAKLLKSQLAHYQGSQIFRLNSSDFACILPNVTLKATEDYANALTREFNDYQQVSNFDSVAYTGLATFTADKPLGELLALIDTAISIAQTQYVNAWYAPKDTHIINNPSAHFGNQNWRQEIDNVIENKRVTLVVQPIKPNGTKHKMYGEVLTRFLNSNKEMLPTASFIAMAEKLDKMVVVDRMIIDKTINTIIEQNIKSQSFGINISARSIHDDHFLVWLERRLLRAQQVTGQLIFEITEQGLQQNLKTSQRFIEMIHRVGSRITIERFGMGLTSFKLFKELKPDFIKMDSSYTRDIDEDKNNQYFLRVMVDLAHRLSIKVLAECVETIEEKHALEQILVDGYQGYYIGKPEPL